MPGLGPRAPDSPCRSHPLAFVSLWEHEPCDLYQRVAEKAQLELLGAPPSSLLPGFFQTSLRRLGHLPMPPGVFCLAESSCTRRGHRGRFPGGNTRGVRGMRRGEMGVHLDLPFLGGWGWDAGGGGPCPAPRLLSIWALTVSAKWRPSQQCPCIVKALVNFQAHPDLSQWYFWQLMSPAAVAGWSCKVVWRPQDSWPGLIIVLADLGCSRNYDKYC